MGTRIQIRRDTSTNWSVNNPVLALGEPGLETDTQIVKYGDGVTTWNSLPYANLNNLADFTTANLAEYSANLYFTNARVYANVDLLDFATNSQIALYATNAQLASYATNAQLGLYATNSQLGSYATNNQLSLYATNSQLSNYATNNQLALYATNNQLNLYATNAQLGNYATNNQLALYATNNQLQFEFLTDVSTSGLTINEIARSAIARYNFTNLSGDYYINSHFSGKNPNIYVLSATTVGFNLDLTEPILIQNNSSGSFANVSSSLFWYDHTGSSTTGSQAQGKTTGTVYLDIKQGDTNSYRYVSTTNNLVYGEIIIKDFSLL